MSKSRWLQCLQSSMIQKAKFAALYRQPKRGQFGRNRLHSIAGPQKTERLEGSPGCTQSETPKTRRYLRVLVYYSILHVHSLAILLCSYTTLCCIVLTIVKESAKGGQLRARLLRLSAIFLSVRGVETHCTAQLGWIFEGNHWADFAGPWPGQ